MMVGGRGLFFTFFFFHLILYEPRGVDARTHDNICHMMSQAGRYGLFLSFVYTVGGSFKVCMIRIYIYTFCVCEIASAKTILFS